MSGVDKWGCSLVVLDSRGSPVWMIYARSHAVLSSPT